MIGVEGQYVYKFSIADKNDFIETQDLDFFSSIEEAGNVLPAWDIGFKTEDNTLFELFNEGNDFKVSFGVTKDDMVEIPLIILSRQVTKSGDNKYQITGSGLFSNIKYITTPYTYITDNISGVEAITEIIGRDFNQIDSNITKSNDSQYWIQPNTTNKKFIDELWMHSYLPNSFLGIALTSTGKFIIKDLQQSIKNGFSFKLTPKASVNSKNEINYLGDAIIEGNSGFINCLAGYQREKPIYTIEGDTHELLTENITPMTAMMKQLARRSEGNRRSDIYGIQNDNTHDNYWNATLRNLSSLAIFSTEALTVSYFNYFNNIKPYDIIMYKEDQLDNLKKQSEEYQSGLWIVGTISRSINNNTFNTTLKVYRESFNSIKGDFS